MNNNKNVSPKEIIQNGLCIGCGSCAALSKKSKVTMEFDRYGQLVPNGPERWAHNKSELFNKTCPFSPHTKNESELARENFLENKHNCDALGKFQTAYVGYAAEEDFRLQGSSGGMVTWVAAELFRKGLIQGLAHVVPADPEKDGKFFRYQISRTESEIRLGAKSRYYPVELSEILQMIEAEKGEYAVVGIPCFIKAIQLLRAENPLFRSRIKYTLGLFCGHMKSARFIESFAWQLNVPVHQIKNVEFRYKDPHRPANWYNVRLTLKDGTTVSQDWWHLVDGDWGAGFFMNSACNYCDDVMAETADISFGDAWVEPYSSDGKGTNVVVVRSREVEAILDNAINEGRLKLETVNQEFVKETQAAGLRQRREGLAYRLSQYPTKIMPRKRIAPNQHQLSRNRKLIFRIRYLISLWSHRIFWLSRRLKMPKLYLNWARIVTVAYHGLSYQRGRLGDFLRKLGLS